jgi:hypothetical protein
VSFDINEFQQLNLIGTEFFVDQIRYSSNKYLIEYRFAIENFESVFTYSQSGSLNLKITPYFDTLGFINPQSYDASSKLYDKGLGFKYNLSNDIGISLEHHIINSYNIYNFINTFNTNSPNIKSYHLGACFSKNNNIFKAGLFNKQYDFDGKKITDNGFTFGTRIEYFKKNNSADIAFVIGERSDINGSVLKESYYKIMLTLVSGEKWFINERKK